MIAHLARTAFKLLLVLSIIVYFYMFQFDLVASYIPQIRQYGPPSSISQAVQPAKKLLRHGLIALADRIYDLAKLLR
ncbi:Oidioi.mRNA.OKI2018_I69.chr2.g4631.t1.cds [Oikopleura dioica]|uniref:Oidioi.mRNA.OKI2018_I69.chr2.g4631.t1.cds n=1 Tax=Oikopleura dioica TaxID=34765 RepID=A0ABN7T4I7_OIKDI|nr:Oidioi.mRNA.OKI2018_I69.chr2.g4631.t1.cds [Oikopleura dioica]